jgi:cyclohexadieny/prephenate dehydrogenase
MTGLQRVLDKVVIIGLGLIGGSLARSLKETGHCREVVAYGHRDESLKKGVVLGVIDSYSMDLDEALAGADVVVIATPVLVAQQLLRDIFPHLPVDCVVTDVASVKGSLLQAAREGGGGVVPPNLVLGHPIAGSERSGVDASFAELFVDHRVILTPTPETLPSALELVREMWISTGARVQDMGVEEHDRILAATSHLPHVLAYALVDALAHSDASAEIFDFAAGGFRDFTRIASSDPVMWRDIALANREELLAAINLFGAHLERLRSAVESADGSYLQQVFTHAKATRDAFAAKKDAS